MIQNINKNHLICAIVFDSFDCLWLYGLPWPEIFDALTKNDLIYFSEDGGLFFLHLMLSRKVFATNSLKKNFCVGLVWDVWFYGPCQRWWNKGPLFGLFTTALPLYFTISDIVHSQIIYIKIEHWSNIDEIDKSTVIFIS